MKYLINYWFKVEQCHLRLVQTREPHPLSQEFLLVRVFPELEGGKGELGSCVGSCCKDAFHGHLWKEMERG